MDYSSVSKVPTLFQNRWLLIGTVFAILVVGLLIARLEAIVRASFEARKRSHVHTIIAEYTVPDQLTPAELGYIIDAVFGSNELLATIAWLYAANLVRLQPDEDGTDFSITPISAEATVPTAIGDAESSVLGYVRSLPGESIRWSQLGSALGTITGIRSDFEEAVLGSLVSKGLLLRGGMAGLLFRRRRASLLVAVLGTIAVGAPLYRWGHHMLVAGKDTIGAGYMGIDRGVSILLFIPVLAMLWLGWYAYANLFAYVYTHRDGVPVGGTKLLNQLWPVVAGYRLFLSETEYVRLQHDRNPRDPAFAYCLALGLDAGFVRSLKP
jgi:hypothetical protein